MTWVRLDDQFPEHPKVDGLSDGAFRLHVAAMCDCSARLTDGFVPKDRVGRLVPRYRKGYVAELVGAGAWHDAEGGWVIHDYLVYNPSAEKVKADRAAAAERMKNRRSRARSGEQRGERSGARSQTPSRPEGSRDGECLSDGDPAAEEAEVSPETNAANARLLKQKLRGEVIEFKRSEAS